MLTQIDILHRQVNKLSYSENGKKQPETPTDSTVYRIERNSNHPHSKNKYKTRKTYQSIPQRVGESIFEHFHQQNEGLKLFSTCKILRAHGARRMKELFEL